MRASADFCVLCPPDATTSLAGRASQFDCLCNPGFYMNTSRRCQRCPLPGSNCSVAGRTIEKLWLEPGYWRIGTKDSGGSADARRLQQAAYSNSTDVRACPDSRRGEDSACTGTLRGVTSTRAWPCPSVFVILRRSQPLPSASTWLAPVTNNLKLAQL